MNTFKYKIAAVVMAAAAGLASCDSFLEEDPKGQQTNINAFTDKSDLEGAVHVLNYWVKMANLSNSMFANQVMGDDYTTSHLGSRAEYQQFDYYSPLSTNGKIKGRKASWSRRWMVVKCANFILENADRTPDSSPEEINDAKAQARFWRGYYYFYMVRTWGELPLITTSTLDLNIGVSSEEDVYKLIVEDLQFAAEHLPANYSKEPFNIGGINRVATRACAEAALADVYMTMAGWPLNKGKEYYKKAAAECKKVIDGCQNGQYYYQLWDDFKDVWARKNEYNQKEYLLAIYSSDVQGFGDSRMAIRQNGEIPNEVGNQAYGELRAELKFWMDFPAGPRKKTLYGDIVKLVPDFGLTLTGPGKVDADGMNSAIAPWWFSQMQTCRNPYFVMWAEPLQKHNSIPTAMPESCRGLIPDLDITEYRQDLPYDLQCGGEGWANKPHEIIRLSEIYCWYAECVGRAGEGDKSEAVRLLNRVRNRADGAQTNLYTETMSYDDLAEAGYNEAGWEEAGNFMNIETRYFSMRRMYRVKDHFEYRRTHPSFTVKQIKDKWLSENPEWASHPSIQMIFQVDKQFGDTDDTRVYELEYPATVSGWSDKMMYVPYPQDDMDLCPNLRSAKNGCE